jgi:pimeloyl-ACP methyl ester carboxylesterase
MSRVNRFIALAAFAASLIHAQDISGDWQGTLKSGSQEIRVILWVAKTDSGDWKATLLSIDQSPDRGVGMQASSFSMDGSNIKFAINQIRGGYDGKLAADGGSIAGTWTQGPPMPLEFRRATKETAWADPSPHTVQFITTEKNVKLEVLDWGGSGRPLVFVPGLGNSAHIFDKFAPRLTEKYHVHGITRRGFGASSAPEPSGVSTYAADRLGDDVLAVLDALKLKQAVLAGHSLGGEELSSIGSRHPERVAGLIYLDAGYSYAFYDRSRGDLRIDSADLQKKLTQLQAGGDSRHLIEELLATTLPGLERDLKEMQKNLPDRQPVEPPPAQPPITQAILAGMQKYTEIHVPVLAIYALPHSTGQPIKDDALRAAAEARDEATTGVQAKAFENGVPSARVVRLPHANHYVFLSNEADVLREMNTFLDGLTAPK